MPWNDFDIEGKAFFYFGSVSLLSRQQNNFSNRLIVDIESRPKANGGLT